MDLDFGIVDEASESSDDLAAKPARAKKRAQWTHDEDKALSRGYREIYLRKIDNNEAYSHAKFCKDIAAEWNVAYAVDGRIRNENQIKSHLKTIFSRYDWSLFERDIDCHLRLEKDTLGKLKVAYTPDRQAPLDRALILQHGTAKQRKAAQARARVEFRKKTPPSPMSRQQQQFQVITAPIPSPAPTLQYKRPDRAATSMTLPLDAQPTSPIRPNPALQSTPNRRQSPRLTSRQLIDIEEPTSPTARGEKRPQPEDPNPPTKRLRADSPELFKPARIQHPTERKEFFILYYDACIKPTITYNIGDEEAIINYKVTMPTLRQFESLGFDPAIYAVLNGINPQPYAIVTDCDWGEPKVISSSFTLPKDATGKKTHRYHFAFDSSIKKRTAIPTCQTPISRRDRGYKSRSLKSSSNARDH